MASLLGKEIGKYRITERIGRGGMAEVYEGVHTHLDRKVAIKVLHSHLLEGGDFVARFKREAKAVANLRHPNIVQVHDFDIQEDLIFMVMEFIDGVNLHTMLVDSGKKKERLPIKLIGSIINDIASALDYAHSKGMLHRDIKPSNILIDKENKAYLTDFGIAKMLDDQKFTATGQLVGTPAYMSPEQGKGEDLTEESDIYSLGVVAFEMLTGQVPYDAKTPIGIVHKQINDPVPSISSLVDGVPGTAQQVIDRALAKSPESRFSTAEDLVAALRVALQALESPESVPISTPEEQVDDILEAPTVTMDAKQLEQPTVVMEEKKSPEEKKPEKEPSQEPTPKPAGEKKKFPVWAYIVGAVALLAIVGVVLTQVLDLSQPSIAGGDPEAVEVFISPNQPEQGIAIRDDVPDGNYEVIDIEGETAFVSGDHQIFAAPDSNSVMDGYLYFDIDDSIMFGLSEGSIATVLITYLDQGRDSFDMQYDAHFGGDLGDGVFRNGGTITKTDSGEFRIAEFNLLDVYFGNRNHGGDIRISDMGDGAEIIHEVRVIWIPSESAPQDEDRDEEISQPAEEPEPGGELSGEELYQEAEQLYNNQAYEDVLALLNQALDSDFETVDVVHLMGRALRQLDRCEEALVFFDRAIELDPEAAWSYYNRGACKYEPLQDYPGAIEDLERAVELDPNVRTFWNVLGLAYYLGDFQELADEAMNAFDRAIELDPDHYLAYYWRGSILWNRFSDYDAALENLTIAVENAPPEVFDVYTERGLVYLSLGDFALCVEDFSKALEINPFSHISYRDRGICYRELGEPDLARADFEEFLALTVDIPDFDDMRQEVEDWIDSME